MQLREWQSELQMAILEDSDRPALQMRPGRLSRRQSLGIYGNAYRARLREALRSNYGALHRLLGDRDFDVVADAFAVAHPPSTPSIRWFGAALPAFLRTHETCRQCPALAELAEFEWALRHTVDAADGKRVDAQFVQAAAAGDWAGFRFDLHRSLSLLEFAWNAPQIWRALDADIDPPEPAYGTGHWLVYRGLDMSGTWRSAELHEIEALQSWREGATFGVICDRLASHTGSAESAALEAATLLRGWLQEGLLVHRSTAHGEPR